MGEFLLVVKTHDTRARKRQSIDFPLELNNNKTAENQWIENTTTTQCQQHEKEATD
jgi:hypothetical protein